MAFDLTQRPFDGSSKDQAKRLSEEAIKTGENTSMGCGTRHGRLNLIFRPSGRVEITWRDHGGLKEGWYMKDWTIETTLRKWVDLMNS